MFVKMKVKIKDMGMNMMTVMVGSITSVTSKKLYEIGLIKLISKMVTKESRSELKF